MQTDKTIKDWMEQVDAIFEETGNFEEYADYAQDNTVSNVVDMLTSLKTEMQEVLDTDYFKPTIALNPTDTLK